MDLSKPGTHANLEAAFGGESMANRKYLFFAEVAKQLGNAELARLFRDTANQETEHAFAHFRLLHPELVVVEEIYAESRFPRTAILMGHARGVICLAARLQDVRRSACRRADEFQRVIPLGVLERELHVVVGRLQGQHFLHERNHVVTDRKSTRLNSSHT